MSADDFAEVVDGFGVVEGEAELVLVAGVGFTPDLSAGFASIIGGFTGPFLSSSAIDLFPYAANRGLIDVSPVRLIC